MTAPIPDPSVYTFTVDDGDTIPCTEMASLFGVTPDQIVAEIRRQGDNLNAGVFDIPDEWARTCRRLAREVTAAAGRELTVREILDRLAGPEPEAGRA